MLTPEQAALEIRSFAKDETGLGNVKSAWAALDVIEKYLKIGAKPASNDEIFGTLFWQHLNLLWKEAFVPLNIVQRYRLRIYVKALDRLLIRWRDMPSDALMQSQGVGNPWNKVQE